MKPLSRRVATISCLLFGVTLIFGPSDLAKLDRATRDHIEAHQSAPLRVIVRARDGAGQSLRDALERRGASIVSEQPSLDSVTATMTPVEILQIARQRQVARVSLDAPVEGTQLLQQVVTGTVLNLPTSRVKDDLLLNSLGLADRKYTGKGVGVAIIDSGFAPGAKSDFWDTNPVFYDFTSTPDGSAVQRSPRDGYGHGSHVAGLIGGSGLYANGLYQGVAPGVRFVVLKALDDNGRGYTSTVINAINFATSHKKSLGIDIINLSLGHPIYEPAATDPLVRAVEAAVRAGIVVVASAGNNGGDPQTHETGYAGVNSPGNAPSALTIGAMDTNGTADRGDDTVPWYSSRGPTWYDGYQKPDIVAPGHHLLSDIDTSSTLYKTYPQFVVSAGVLDNPGRYFRLSGTSMATAVTSGVVALVIDAGRQKYGEALPPNAIKAVLEYTALPLSGLDPLTQGTGGLNAAGAIALAEALDPSADTGAWWLRVPVHPLSKIAGKNWLWSQRILWGDRVLDGEYIYTDWPAWAQRVVWGNRVVWGDRVIWGNSTVWGDDARMVWGDRVIWGNGLIGYTDGDRVIWGNGTGDVAANRVIWGNVADSQLSSLSSPSDPYGFRSLDEANPLTGLLAPVVNLLSGVISVLGR